MKFDYRIKQAVPHCQGMMVNIPIAYKNEHGQTMLDVKESIRSIRGSEGLYCYIRVGGKKVKLLWNKNFGGFIQEGLL